MCAEGGPAIAIANIFINLIAVVSIYVLVWKRDKLQDATKIGVEDGRWFCLPTRQWMIITLIWLFVGIVFLLAAIGDNEWVIRDPVIGNLKGSLLRCENCDANYDWIGWDCLAGTTCAQNDESGKCEMYENLRDSSRSYITLAGITVICIAMFIQVVTGVLSGRDYGIPLLNYVIFM